MNIYIVVEGKTEKPVYKCWIPLVNPDLKYVDHIEKVVNDNFCIIAGEGYPNYFSVIEDAILDVNNFGNIDKLVIAVDSEDDTREEKFSEIQSFISDKHCVSTVAVIIQHFCIETWALGNRRIVRKNPQSRKLINYKRIFDVSREDPELLTSLPVEELNRSQFAYKYLKACLRERFSNLTYTKKNPKPLVHQRYFREVKARFEDKGHISSFADFLNAFSE